MSVDDDLIVRELTAEIERLKQELADIHVVERELTVRIAQKTSELRARRRLLLAQR